MSARHCYREMRYIQQLGLDLWQSGKTVCQEFSRGRTLDLVSFTRVLAVLAAMVPHADVSVAGRHKEPTKRVTYRRYNATRKPIRWALLGKGGIDGSVQP